MEDKWIRIGSLTIARNEIKYYLLGLIVLILALWAWGYRSLLVSDSYAYSKAYITSNLKVKEALGEIESVRPRYINFKRQFGGGIWNDKYYIVVEGKKNSGSIFIQLKGTGSDWKVENAMLKTEDEIEISL